jgi:hypothetical protein
MPAWMNLPRLERAVPVVNIFDVRDALRLHRRRPFVKNGDGRAAVMLGDVVIADARIAAAENPQIVAVLREIRHRAGIGTEEIQRRRRDAYLPIARRHHRPIRFRGIQLAPALELNHPRRTNRLRHR